MKSAPEIADKDRAIVKGMTRRAMTGWYVGDEESLRRYCAVTDLLSVTTPEVAIRLLFSRDKMHHSVGWWRNAEYEYCWHLSMSAWDAGVVIEKMAPTRTSEPYDVPEEDERYWTHAFFPVDFNKVWHEPGGTDPRLTLAEKMRHRHFVHQRLFLDPETFEPFVPTGEVYQLTRWLPGLTPDKVDR